MSREVDGLRRRDEERLHALSPEHGEQQVDVADADGRAVLPAELAHLLHLALYRAAEAVAHVADEVAQVVLHDAAARHVRGRRDDVDSVHLIGLAGADERKGVDVGAGEARLELLREHDAYRVLAVAVRGDEERRPQLFEDFPAEAERVAQRDLDAGNVEREVEAQLPRHIRQVLLRADEAVCTYLRGELFKLRYFVFGEYVMVAVGPPLGDRDAQLV